MEMKRPVILVDLDNVVYDWTRTMASWLYLNGAVDVNVPTLMSRYSQWSVWDDWGIQKGEFLRWWRLGIEADYVYREGQPMTKARDALWQLSDAEWHIHIATSRLTKFGLHDKIVENTVGWLRGFNIPYRSLSFTDDKCSIKADAIVDDRQDNMNFKVHGVTFEFGAPHNKSKVTWDTVLKALL